MPVSFEFLRGVLGVLGIFFAYLAGRAGAQVRKGQQKLTRFYGWVIRATACLIVISIRHELGALDIAIWVLSAASFALGWWNAAQAKPPEDLSHEIFPES
ncbi:MAG TPA: hypothetical protein VH640_18300 [Bryobacteraceae bacterium]